MVGWDAGGIKVCFDVTDMHRGATVQEEGVDGRVDGGARTLVGRFIGDPGEVDLFGMAAPIDTRLEVNGSE
jgi:hypothetical protein